MRLLILLACPWLVAPQLPTQAERQPFARVWVVDAVGGGQYTAIQPAIQAAQPGDTILVKGGTYAGFDLVGKGLTIVGEAGATVSCTTSSLVNGVPADQRALLQNLRWSAGHAYGVLRITSNAGAVRIEDCIVAGPTGATYDALYVRDSSDVLLRGVQAHGASSPNLQVFTPPAGNGGSIGGSNVAAYRSQFIGGAGGGGNVQVGGAGGSGCLQAAGELRTVQSVFTGGAGGESTDCFSGLGGRGGDGLGMLSPGPSPTVRSQASTFTGGMGGLHACGYAGSHGGGVVLLPGALTTVPGPARTLDVPPLVRDGSNVVFTFGGATGELVYLLISAHDTHAASAAYEGVLFARPSYLLRAVVGEISATVPLTYTWAIPDELIPESLSLTFTAQAVFQSPTGPITLSNPVTMVVLDHAL